MNSPTRLNSGYFLAIAEILAHNWDEPMINLDRITVTCRSRSVLAAEDLLLFLKN